MVRWVTLSAIYCIEYPESSGKVGAKRHKKSRKGFSYGLYVQNICSHDSKERDFRIFVQKKIIELEQFFFFRFGGLL